MLHPRPPRSFAQHLLEIEREAARAAQRTVLSARSNAALSEENRAPTPRVVRRQPELAAATSPDGAGTSCDGAETSLAAAQRAHRRTACEAKVLLAALPEVEAEARELRAEVRRLSAANAALSRELAALRADPAAAAAAPPAEGSRSLGAAPHGPLYDECATAGRLHSAARSSPAASPPSYGRDRQDDVLRAAVAVALLDARLSPSPSGTGSHTLEAATLAATHTDSAFRRDEGRTRAPACSLLCSRCGRGIRNPSSPHAARPRSRSLVSRAPHASPPLPRGAFTEGSCRRLLLRRARRRRAGGGPHGRCAAGRRGQRVGRVRARSAGRTRLVRPDANLNLPAVSLSLRGRRGSPYRSPLH